ncbi:MAG: hypothetical protein E7048_06195 [Lentisphaerae bacterium]|nr:hypothetical protein [Lentisphaerota bacterium]
MFKKIRWSLEFVIVYIPYQLLRLLPWPLMRAVAWCLGLGMYLLPGARKLVKANIHAAMPELSEAEVKRIARKSFDHLCWNLVEYVWMTGKEKRIRRCCEVEEKTLKKLKSLVRDNVRIIYVNPHLGSWEASGLMSPYYAGVNIAAIAKPLRNPYLNSFFNTGNRENTSGLRIIFSKGAMRAAIQALKEGMGVGTLIDQNTRVRDGGVFVNFFGLPVPSSTAPAVLKSYCDQKGMPSRIIIGCSLRKKNGKVMGEGWELPKPFEEYASHTEVLQDLMTVSEKIIRENPEQYLWMYRRFQYIPENVTAEQRKRYPWYAIEPGKNFYLKVRERKADTDGETCA